jgi:hypothetical protein
MPLQRGRNIINLLLLTLTVGAGCSKNADDPGAAEGGSGLEASDASSDRTAVRWGETITLEENTDVINVAPHVSLDDAGNFVIADQQEQQVRLYEPVGRLIRHLGRKGSGPGEFQSLVSALPLSSGETVVVERSGRGAVFPANGDKVSRTFQIRLASIWEASLVSDSLLLVAGRLPSTSLSSPLLHLVDLESMAIRKSFFPPPQTAVAGKPIENNIGFVSATVHGDSIAAVYSVSDTVYVFNHEGNLLSRVPLRSENFRRIKSPPPPRGSNLEDLLKWVSTFSLMTQVFPAPDGGYLVQYQDREGKDLNWRLARIAPTGGVLFDLQDTPRLVASAGDGSRLWFIDPNSEAPNRWVSATLSR